MRGGLSTIQQTLMPEAAAVLAASMAEAGRRNHGHTTPLHVAATLLSSPTGFLRQACVRSHPNSSHPLQCRALELCFSVALERLPSTASGSEATATLPQPSNALMAALKRAQAHQRRGLCPEQQQPLLAVKVELEQLIISILDDPGVSRVMKEASFSSPSVKAAIEQSLSSSATAPPVNQNMYASLGLHQSGDTRFEEINRSMYRNLRLQQSGSSKSLEIDQISEILSRSNKRNPILVGENEPRVAINDIKRKLEKGELLEKVEIIPLENHLVFDKSQFVKKIREFGNQLESRIGIVLDLGDLKWLVEMEAEAGRAVVDEVAKIVARFHNGGLWLIGIASCETYMRCQIYYPTVENDWDLQAIPIASHSPFTGMFPRLGGNGILNSSIDSIYPMKSFGSTNAIPRQVPENIKPKPKQTPSFCPQCNEKYEQELAKLVANEYEKSSLQVRTEQAGPPLPQWLQNAKSVYSNATSSDKSQTKDREMVFKQKTEELQKKWTDTCLCVHPSFNTYIGSQRPQMNLYNPKLLLNQPLQNKLLSNKSLGSNLQLNSNIHLEKLNSPPRSPVRTELALGRPKISEITKENTENNCIMDLLGCISSKVLDTDSYKKLLNLLMEKVWWQKEAASKVASIVTKSKSGEGKRRGSLSKGDTWLLFTGPDRIGKKKMASVISEQICGGDPVIISLGRNRSDEEIVMNFRGKMVIDRVVEAVKRNPFSIIVLEDYDEANLINRGIIKSAMEGGRIADSYGREISLGNVVFILTANSSPDNFTKLRSDEFFDENKLKEGLRNGWQLRLRISEKRAKRRIDWLDNNHRLIKPRKELNLGLSLDLNLTVDIDDDQTDGSHNSSDLTVDYDDDQIRRSSNVSIPIELADLIDDAIDFKPLETVSIKKEIKFKISEKFSNIVDDMSLEVDEEALEKIFGGVWLGQTSFEEWGKKVLLPSFERVKTNLPSATSSDENVVVRLEFDRDSGSRSSGDWLPSSIRM